MVYRNRMHDFGYMNGGSMKNPLESIAGTILSGVLLTVALVFFLKNFVTVGA